MPLSQLWVPATLCLHRVPSNTSMQVWFSLLWSHCSFPLGLSLHKILCVPCKSLFFPLSCGSLAIKSCWSSKSDFLWTTTPIAGLSWGSESSLHCEILCGIVVLSLWVTNRAGMGFDVIMIVSLLPLRSQLNPHCNGEAFLDPCKIPLYKVVFVPCTFLS